MVLQTVAHFCVLDGIAIACGRDRNLDVAHSKEFVLRLLDDIAADAQQSCSAQQRKGKPVALSRVAEYCESRFPPRSAELNDLYERLSGTAPQQSQSSARAAAQRAIRDVLHAAVETTAKRTGTAR
jgi:hypothetical protein